MMLLCLLMLLPAADDEKAARALLDRAIAAMGGEKLLSAPHAITGKSRGTGISDEKTTVNNTFKVQGLDRLLWDSELGTSTFKIGMSPKGVWISGNGNPANDVAKEHADAFRRGVVALRVAEGLVFLRGKEWKLSSLGELKIDDRLAVGIKASRKGEPTIDLYLDKKTLLPVKVEVRLPKPGESAEMALSAQLSDYKKIAGRQHFTKMVITQDGKKVLEMERSEIKVVDKLDDATFEKP